jgi:nicotinate-nucleotide adenylyltransferase
MTTHRRLGVLGGTFDPIHFGHLDAGDAAQSALGLDEVLVIPAHDPPHRPIDPHASAFHRFALVALAISDRSAWRVSDAETARTGPSYTVDTLRALRAEGWPASHVFFILGADAFADIAAWYAFPAVLDEAHFVVIARPGTTVDAAVARTPALQPRVRRVRLSTSAEATAGPRRSAECEGGQVDPEVDLQVDEGNETGIFLIAAHTRDVSSTQIRARIAAGLPIDDLVPPAVARHVAAHRLYEVRDSGLGTRGSGLETRDSSVLELGTPSPGSRIPSPGSKR